MSEGPRYAFVDEVTSDLSFEAWGASLEELFAAAADALAHASLGEEAHLASTEFHSVDLGEPDLELLLLRFLSELIYLRDARFLLLRPHEIEITRDGQARLRGRLAGERLAPGSRRLELDVKAVTAYGLSVEPDARGWHASVTLDV